MLERFRGPQANVDASFAVVWTHLRKRYPRLRTVLVTAASARDDATLAAVGLAQAAARLDGSRVLVTGPDAAKGDRNGLDSPVPTHDVVPAKLEIEGGATPPAMGLADFGTLPDQQLPMTADVSSQSLRSVRVVDALSSTQVRTALSDSSGDFAFTIVVAPAPQTGSDCISLASAADAIVLVATLGRTRFRDARLAATLLRQAGVPTATALLLTKEALRSRTLVQADGTADRVTVAILSSDSSSTARGSRRRAGQT